MPQYDDDLLLSPVIPGGGSALALGIATANHGVLAGNAAAGSSPMYRGIGPLGRVFVMSIAPAAIAAATIAALQTTAGAATLALTAGAGVTSVVRSDGTTVLQLDVPRAVSLTSTGNISAVNFTISGFDIYGQPMTQTRAGPNNNTVNTLKAFFQIASITVSGAVATNTSVGVADIFGLPVRVPDASLIVRAGWDNVLAENAGTFVKADDTSPATAATGDVRGTFAQAGNASNGTRRLTVTMALTGDQVGPRGTRALALGVTQV